MTKKILTALILLMLVFLAITPAYALPKPRSAHYPRGGRLTLSPMKQSTNTFAFRASGKTDRQVILQINNAYAMADDTAVTIQMFVVNKWGNWIAFGSPQVVNLHEEPASFTLYFTIRPRKPFCIVVSSYGTTENIVIPYVVITH